MFCSFNSFNKSSLVLVFIFISVIVLLSSETVSAGSGSTSFILRFSEILSLILSQIFLPSSEISESFSVECLVSSALYPIWKFIPFAVASGMH